jgi:hypothetical protein
MAVYEDFLEYVAPAVPGAPEPLLIRAIRDACIDFCVETQLFQQALEPIPSIAGIADYTIETPDDTKVSMVMKAWYDGTEITDITQDEATVNTLTTQFGTTPETGTPRRLVYTGSDTVLLDPVPDTSAKDLVLVAALKPSRASTTVFDQLYEDYAEAIGEGALSKLMNIKSTVFYDPNESLLKAKKFREAMNKGMVRANQGNLGRKSLRVRFRTI